MDSYQDLSSDEQGESVRLGGLNFQSGKQKTKEFRMVYKFDKSYLTWVRDKVKPGKNYSVNQLEFRMYVELRDNVKKERIFQSMNRARARPPRRVSVAQSRVAGRRWPRNPAR